MTITSATNLLDVLAGHMRPSEKLPAWTGPFAEIIAEERILRHVRCAPKHHPLPFKPVTHNKVPT